MEEEIRKSPDEVKWMLKMLFENENNLNIIFDDSFVNIKEWSWTIFFEFNWLKYWFILNNAQKKKESKKDYCFHILDSNDLEDISESYYNNINIWEYKIGMKKLFDILKIKRKDLYDKNTHNNDNYNNWDWRVHL